jgi:NADPH-dependent curcumin reductase CurA
MPVNRQILLVEKPTDRLQPEHFRLVEGQVPEIGDGEVLVRTRLISLDAANRAWMHGATYRSAVEAGQVMAGGAIAEVIESRAPGLEAGDLVFADTGWQDFTALPARRAKPVPRVEPMSHLLSVYGVAGLTAYFGLLECGRPQAGETVVVSAAAGSVGSIVGQIARVLGCTVVGTCGSDEKARWLIDELGFDHAINYRAGSLREALKAACPDGIDVYFDNVGGETLEVCLAAMKLRGRIACCGAIAQYDGPAPEHGPRGVPGLIVTKRLTLQGFIVSDFAPRYGEAVARLRQWVESGAIRVEEDIIDGLENTPGALIGLLAGENRGKRMVRV